MWINTSVSGLFFLDGWAGDPRMNDKGKEWSPKNIRELAKIRTKSEDQGGNIVVVTQHGRVLVVATRLHAGRTMMTRRKDSSVSTRTTKEEDHLCRDSVNEEVVKTGHEKRLTCAMPFHSIPFHFISFHFISSSSRPCSDSALAIYLFTPLFRQSLSAQSLSCPTHSTQQGSRS